ncbi:MAG: hypothetical protein FJ387_19715 [Verrucomicrobia bacterium]|nr:hypothetical protein [Verrucomicrobiota bacterium]
MRRSIQLGLLGLSWVVLSSSHASAGTLTGYLRDPNWFARRAPSDPFGVGYYEFAINANPAQLVLPGGADDTDVYGFFQMTGLPAGTYSVASWDVWWRSAYAFNVVVPPSGTVSGVDLRLEATQWGYPAFWDDTGYEEFGQTFVATGPVAMIYLRSPANTSYRLTLHQGGPGGTPLGVARTFAGANDHRLVYGWGEMPTVAGQTYYVRIRTTTPGVRGVLMQMDPRPDLSDPMPGGCLWLGNGTTLLPYLDRDLGLVIMSDDDGLLTNLYTRSNGASLSGALSLGQTLIARGIGLISAALWLADPAAPFYAFRVLEGGPTGPQVGTTKLGKPARVGADPEVLVVWAPGECPLTTGQVYYLEVTRATHGSLIQSAYTHSANPFPHGQAYRNGVPLVGTDLAGTLMEEAHPGSAAQPRVRLVREPAVAEPDRGTDRFIVRWTTDVPASSAVQYAANHPPYTQSVSNPTLNTDHAVALPDLAPHTLYHLQVRSEAPGYRARNSRDFVACTRPIRPNLLANPSFEQGSGASPRRTIPGWSKSGGLDMAASDGTWFWGLEPHTGAWLFEGAVNGSSSEAHLYQRVAVTAGRPYTFSAWVITAFRENNTWKYDVWNNRGRLNHVRLGIDPTGGTQPNAATVRWTPRFYSHLRYTPVALTTTASGSTLTVFFHFQGEGGQWHLYGVDDCALTEREPQRPHLTKTEFDAEGAFRFLVEADAGRLNRVETSTNLADWSVLTETLNNTGVLPFSHPEVPLAPARFYRAMVPE